jgi:methanogenic corrinoid protein MtbC1
MRMERKSVLDQVDYHELTNLFRMGLTDSVSKWFNDNANTQSEKSRVLEKVLFNLGVLWQRGDIPLTALYVSSKIAEHLVAKQFDSGSPLSEEKRKVIILGTMKDDYHTLGKLIVKRFLSPFFDVHDIGVNVDAKLFVKTAKEKDADIIAVSALMMNSVYQIPNLRALIDATEWKKKPLLLVGGAPFSVNPNLYTEIGADAFVDSAVYAVQKINELLEGR